MSRIMKSFQVNMGMPLRVQHLNFETNEIESEEPCSIDTQVLLDNANVEAEAIIEGANNEAKRILEDARQQAEKIKEEIFKQAKEEGYQQGYQEILRKEEDLLREAKEIKESAQQEYQSIMISAEKDIIHMVMDIAKKIIVDEMQSRHDAVQLMVAQTLSDCKGTESVTVKISPQHYEDVQQNKDFIIQQSGFSGEIIIKEDLSLKPGDCVIETPVGNIDAGAQTQLKEIEDAFRQLLRE